MAKHCQNKEKGLSSAVNQSNNMASYHEKKYIEL